MEPREPSFYTDIIVFEYDVDLFIEKLLAEEQIDSYSIFQTKIKEREREWLSKDLVVDIRESWGDWFNRNVDFDDPPMVPREELPEEYQPHNSIYGKLASYANGVNPYPPGHEYNPIHSHKRRRNDIENNNEKGNLSYLNLHQLLSIL